MPLWSLPERQRVARVHEILRCERRAGWQLANVAKGAFRKLGARSCGLQGFGDWPAPMSSGGGHRCESVCGECGFTEMERVSEMPSACRICKSNKGAVDGMACRQDTGLSYSEGFLAVSVGEENRWAMSRREQGLGSPPLLTSSGSWTSPAEPRERTPCQRPPPLPPLLDLTLGLPRATWRFAGCGDFSPGPLKKAPDGFTGLQGTAAV